jgi:hypothetical protein
MIKREAMTNGSKKTYNDGPFDGNFVLIVTHLQC